MLRTIPADKRILDRSMEKITKYQDLRIELKHLRNKKTRIIPVVIGALGTISEHFHSYIKHVFLANCWLDHFTNHCSHQPLKWSNSVRYPGAVINGCLTWCDHCRSVVSKAVRVLNFYEGEIVLLYCSSPVPCIS